MKLFIPCVVFSTLAVPAAAALRGNITTINSKNKNDNETDVLQGNTAGVYMQAVVQYGDGAPTRVEETDHVKLPDGSIHPLVGGPPGLAKKFASGQSKIELPPGAFMRADGKIDLKGNSPTNKGKDNNIGSGDGNDNNGRGPFDRSLEQERGLTDVEGTKTVLSVRVKAADASTTSNCKGIRDAVFHYFRDPVNLVSQYSNCSHGKLQFRMTRNKYVTGNGVASNIYRGVMEVTVPTATSDGDVAMTSAISRELV